MSTTISVPTAAREAGVSAMTIYRLVHAGTIPAVRVGRSIRIRRVDWAKYLEDARITPGEGPYAR